MSRLTPRMIYNELCKTVIGQDEAKRMISTVIFMHFVRNMQTNITKEKVSKSNALLMGPSGTGKTYIVKQAIKAIRDLTKYNICPLVEIDCTEITSRGWEGDDVSKFIKDHYDKCNDEIVFNTSIIFLDEFDKLCNSTLSSRGSDPNRETQYNLLKTIEGMEISHRGNTFSTDKILFILAGNFPQIREKRAALGSKVSMGFTDTLTDQDRYVDVHTELDAAGMATQIVGRIPNVAELKDLTEEELTAILDTQLIPEYESTWKFLGRELSIPEDKRSKFVKSALERKTGARGLHCDVAKYLEGQAFDMEFNYE